MISKRFWLLMLTLIGSLLSGTAAANSVRIYELSADEWSRPRAGSVIPEMEPVRLAIGYWESTIDAAIVLNYPGDDSGELWAAELKDWMITLGVPSDYISLAPGLQMGTDMRITVGARSELQP